MPYKIKWRVDGSGPLHPQTFATEEQAKAAARKLLADHGHHVTIDVWNDDETWQIITPAGVAEWSKN
jgi:hypothetical protein